MPNLLYQPRVFISHSAKEPGAQALCAAIAAALQPDYEVLWDANLPDSAAWRGAIDEWIWNCDAAVLVLSGHALDSRYVAYEAAHLRQRWLHRKPHFPLVPVWCPGVDDHLLAEKMGAIQIAEIHTKVKLADWPAAGCQTPFEDAVQGVLRAVESVRLQSQARHEIEELLTLDLELGTTSDAALTAIADAYRLPPLPPGAKKDRSILLARLLLDSGEPLGDARFQRLRSGIPVLLAGLESARDRVPRIVKLVAPFCWVPPDRAGRIPECLAPHGSGLRAIGWVRKWNLSERMFLYRAFCTRSKIRIASPSDLSGGGTPAVFEHIRACLAEKVCHDANAGAAAVARRLKKLADGGEPVFLILCADSVGEGFLRQICAEWPQLCLFLYSETMSEDQFRAQFPNVHLVEPPLREEDESDARCGWGDCMTDAGWSYQQLQNVEVFES